MGYEQLDDFSSRSLAKRSGDILTAEEETALWQTWFESTDEKARQKARETILLKHMPLCKKMAEQSAKKDRLSADDFFGEAYTEMTALFEKYDRTMGARFSTYIEQRIKGVLHEAAINSGQIKAATTKRSRHMFSNWGELNRQALKDDGSISDYQRHKKIADIVRAYNPEDFKNITADEVADFETRLRDRDNSLDRPVKSDEEGGCTRQTFMAASWGDATQRLEDNDQERVRLLLHRIVDSPKLNDRERTIIKQRHLADEDNCPTLKDLAQEFGVSIQRVQQIEEEGLRKVRQAMKWRPLPVRV
jgi:RNA polymerase sigma-32 factor